MRILYLIIIFSTPIFCSKWDTQIVPRLKENGPWSTTLKFKSSPPKDTQHKGCGETRIRLNEGDHGIISSPGYPGHYDKGIDCEYRYESSPGTVIVSTIFDMRTQNALLSDISDSLYLSLTGNWSNSQRFSGDLNAITPMVFISDANSMAVRFVSSPFSTGNRGFRMGYIVRAGSNTGKPAASEPAHDVWTVVWCNYSPVDHPQIFPSEGISRITRSDSTEHETLRASARTNPNPFLVAMILDDEQFCSGTLISDRHVVTSAHCTRGVKNIQMIFGTDNLAVSDSNVQRRNVNNSAVNEHPFFDPGSGANDISVVELSEPVEFTKNVGPAALPAWSFLATTFAGFRGEIVGWGDAKSGTIYTQANNKSISLAPNSICSLTNRNSNGQTMCSKPNNGPSAAEDGRCQADSGSPIITRGAACVQGPGAMGGDGDVNVGPQGMGAQRPPRPQKPIHPVKPQKPGRPNRPGKPGRPNRPNRPNGIIRDGEEEDLDGPEYYQTNALLGVVSYGSCERGFSFTRITAYLDFLTRFVNVGNDA